MRSKKQTAKTIKQKAKPFLMPERSYHGRIFAAPDQDKHLDSGQLHRLEKSFRDWTEATSRPDVRVSRRRILIIFLLDYRVYHYFAYPVYGMAKTRG